MRQVREVLRLQGACGLSDRKIAQSLRLSRPPGAQYVRRATAAGLAWPLPEALHEEALERRLVVTAHHLPSFHRPLPDWALVHQERQRKGVTLVLLWQAYKAATPDGLQDSSFCEAYRTWAKQLDRVMRHSHRAGETLFVDYAGQKVPVVDPRSGEVHDASIFIAVLGASHSTFAQATWSPSLPDWIGSHVRAFEALGGVPQVLVPDNLKAAVSRSHRYEPERNRTYEALAQHYGVAVVPARAARPRDTAQVEVGVQLVERWMLARLRHHPFFSLPELPTALGTLLVDCNHRPFKKLPGCRHRLFASVDRPALRPLPATPEEYAEWTLVRVNIDDHVEIAGHYSSGPSTLVTQPLDARISAQTVERFHKGKRLASPRRSQQTGRPTTVSTQMPQAHRP